MVVGAGGGGGNNDDDGGGNDDGGSDDDKYKNLEIHFISAGGYYDDTILIRNSSGAVLVDGGRMKTKDLLAYIQGIGVTKLNYMIGSHIEEDHVKVQRDIAAKMPVGKAYYPVKPDKCSPWCNSGGQSPLVDAMRGGLSVVVPNPGSTMISLGATKIFFIGSDRSTWGQDANYSSIVNLIKYGNTTFMLTGDKENICQSSNVALLKAAAKNFGISSLKVDVYKWPHHGNSGCTNSSFLQELSPSYVLVPNNGASWSICKGGKCDAARKQWGNKTKWLPMKVYKYVVFVSDGKTIDVKYNKEPSYWKQ